ncbi:hypothetical protein CBS101457_004572 [Exobasidium rhododendri]|nr:hypothetical protein CBS101457_004572 [Exobasidium rhododendri]
MGSMAAWNVQHLHDQKGSDSWQQVSGDLLNSPLQLSTSKQTSNDPSDETEDEDRADRLFSNTPSPSDTVQTTPDWNVTPIKSTAYNTKAIQTPIRSPLRPAPAATSDRQSPAMNRIPIVQAAHDRPLYHDRTHSSGSTGSNLSPTSRNPAAAKRQLMPSIPVRRDSTGNQGGQSEGAMAKTSTNIQTLAQAIALRAQHVAAANLAKEAGNVFSPTTVIPSALKSPDSISGRTSPSGSIPKSVSESGSDLGSTRSEACFTARSFVESEGSTPKAANFAVGDTEAPTAGRLEPDGSNSAEQNRMSDGSVYSTKSFRWSKGDWADYSTLDDQIEREERSGTEEETHFNDTMLSKFKSSDSEHSTSTAQTSNSHGDLGPKVESGSSQESNNDQHSRRKLLSMAGLGIVGGADLPSSHVVVSAAPAASSATSSSSSSSSPLSMPIASTTLRSVDSFVTASDSISTHSSLKPSASRLAALESSFPTSPSIAASGPSSLVSSPLNGGGIKRKSRPAALSLSPNGHSSIVKTPTLTAYARTLASPTMAGKTPPPSMPPAEPLPPLPPTPASGNARHSFKNGHLLSPKVNTFSDEAGPLMAAFAMAQNTQSNKNRLRQESDPIPTNIYTDVPMSAKSSQESPRTPGSAGRHRSTKSVSASALAGKSAAMVFANHVSTIAGGESAQATLDKVALEPSFNEKRASMRNVAKMTSPKRSSAPAMSSPKYHQDGQEERRDLSSMRPPPLIGANAEDGKESNKTPAAVNDDVDGRTLLPYDEVSSEGGERIDEDDDQEDDDDDGEEEEEAVVTRVTSTGTYKPPLLVRTESVPPLTARSSLKSEDGHNGQLLNVVGRLRAQIESKTSPPIGESVSTLPNKATAGPPSAWTTIKTPMKAIIAARAHQVADSTLTSAAGTASRQGQVEPWTPSGGTPTLSISHSDGGYSTPNLHDTFPPLQNRRSEMEVDRSRVVSPDDTMGRLKRTEGRFVGAYGEIAIAFKQLQAEKRTLEKVIRATTPLEGVGDGEDLSQYLTTMSSKLALSVDEIRKLLDLLDQQRSIMDYMLETHQLELEAYEKEIDELNDELDEGINESETHRMSCVRLTEELDRAHSDQVTARAETLRMKGMLAEEESRREKGASLLRSAKMELAKTEGERTSAIKALQVEQKAHNETKDAHNETKDVLLKAESRHVEEVSSLRRDLQRFKGDSGTIELECAAGEWKEMQDELASLRLHVAAGQGKSSTPARTSPPNESSLEDQIAFLTGQLQESQKREAATDAQLQDLKKRGGDEASVGSLSPLIASGPSDVEEALRDKLVQQEKDIAELRAAVALSGGAASTNEEQLASLPAGRADQINILLADLAEKRTREVQIRSAYKQLRDELRKVQLAQHQDRKRHQASYSYISASGGGSGSSSGHGVPPPSSFSLISPVDSSTPSTPSMASGRETSRQLKRLSLPLVSKQFSTLKDHVGSLEGGLPYSHVPTLPSPTPSPLAHRTISSSNRKLSIDAGHHFHLFNGIISSNRQYEEGTESNDSPASVNQEVIDHPLTEESVESMKSPSLA